METKVEGIVVLIRGERHELTLDEARKLLDALNAALAKPPAYEPYPVGPWFPIGPTWNPKPYVIDTTDSTVTPPSVPFATITN